MPVVDLLVVVEESAPVATGRLGLVVEETAATTADGAGGQSSRRRCTGSAGAHSRSDGRGSHVEEPLWFAAIDW